MPFRDLFRPPLNRLHRWEAFHSAWPTMLVARLNAMLPPRYFAEPRYRVGTEFEIDLGAYEQFGLLPPRDDAGGGVATATYLVPTATAESAFDFGELPEAQVGIYDAEGGLGRTLVAAIEFVSPGKKDREENRKAFVAKCSFLLQQRVTVTIVDAVTTRSANFCVDILDHLGSAADVFGDDDPGAYALTLRPFPTPDGGRLAVWAHALVPNEALPELPTFLGDDLAIPVDLEGSFEDTCGLLRIG